MRTAPALAPLDPIDGTLSPGGLITATIDAAGEQDLYTFNGNAGDVVSLSLVLPGKTCDGHDKQLNTV